MLPDGKVNVGVNLRYYFPCGMSAASWLAGVAQAQLCLVLAECGKSVSRPLSLLAGNPLSWKAGGC